MLLLSSMYALHQTLLRMDGKGEKRSLSPTPAKTPSESQEVRCFHSGKTRWLPCLGKQSRVALPWSSSFSVSLSPRDPPFTVARPKPFAGPLWDFFHDLAFFSSLYAFRASASEKSNDAYPFSLLWGLLRSENLLS